MQRRPRLKRRRDLEDESAERTCIATGRTGGKGELLRFVLDPSGVVTADFGEKLPGRGAWVAASRTAVATAARKNAFARAFRRDARLPDGVDAEGFAAMVEHGLRARALSALGLARRTGAAVTGTEKSRALAEAQGAAVVLIARDASDGGAEKFIRASGAAPVCRAFMTEEQSQAFGSGGVVYAALKASPAADRFQFELGRLEGYRDGAEAGDGMAAGVETAA